MSKSNFVQEFITRLDGKVSREEMRLIAQELEKFTSNFDISARDTALCLFDGLPSEYKIYMVTKKMGGLADSSLKVYKLYIEHMLMTINKPLGEITANDIRLYLIQIKEQRKISDRSVNSRRLIINGFFGWLADQKYIENDPMAVVEPIKYEEKPRKPFSDKEVANLRYACRTNRDRAILEVFLSSGCRCSELGHLKKSDIDWHTGKVHLFGKGKKHRESWISAEAVVALERYFAERTDDSDNLFVSERKPHNPLGNAGIEKIMKQIGERAGVDDVHPHRARHTFATNAIAHGMELPTLQYLLGHAKPETTMIYVTQSSTKVESEYHRCIA